MNEVPRPWWLRLGDEPPEPTSGCPAPDCDAADLTPVDLYCRTHERFLPGATDRPSRSRWLLANAVRVAVCAALLLTAHLDAGLPVALVAVAIGWAVLALPVRRYRLAYRYTSAAWAVACLFAALWWGHPNGWIAMTVLVGLVWLAYVAVGAGHRGGAEGGAAVSFALAAIAAFGWAGLRLVRLWRPGWDPFAEEAVLAAAIVGFGSALLTAVIGAVLDRAGPVNRVTEPVLRRPRRPSPPAWRPGSGRLDSWRLDSGRLDSGHPGSGRVARGRPVGPADRLARLVTRLLRRALEAAVRIGLGAVASFRYFLYACAMVTVVLVNWLHRGLVLARRRLLRAVHTAKAILVDGVRIAGRTLLRSVRVVLLCAGLIGAAAGAAFVAADHARRYLVGGSLAALGGLGLTALGGAVALTLAWMLLCGLPWRISVRSVAHSAGIASANGLLLLAAGGWVVGVPGLLGAGPIRVGWLTVTSTAVLVAATLWSQALRRRPPAHPLAEHGEVDPNGDRIGSTSP